MAIIEPQSFTLDPRLKADSIHIADLEVCQVRLMNDSRYLWALLIPRIKDAREWHRLEADESFGLHNEMRFIAKLIETQADAFKMNVGALGNMVPQLHLHIIARQEGDAAWPGPVWGVGTAVPYDDVSAQRVKDRLWRMIKAVDMLH
ncbi:MAG: HIT family protein [Alphaproteobacteria bacterium]